MSFIDLSVLFEPDTLSDIPIMRPHFQYSDHETGAGEMMKTYGCSREDLPAGGCCADTRISCADHSGTHMDAPWHYAPTMNGGERARTIDEMPMEWCMGNGVCIHFQDKPDGYKVTAADLEQYFRRIDYQLRPLDIVLLHTGAQKNYGRTEYGITGCGVGREATLWLLRQGVKVVGTDAWSWDVPLPLVAKEFAKTKDPSVIWEGHLAGMEMEYYQMEKMTHLDLLPVTGFQVICFPIKIKGGSAGWVRPIAVL